MRYRMHSQVTDATQQRSTKSLSVVLVSLLTAAFISPFFLSLPLLNVHTYVYTYVSMCVQMHVQARIYFNGHSLAAIHLAFETASLFDLELARLTNR